MPRHPPQPLKPNLALARLYHRLAADADVVADREERYAAQALSERKFAGMDKIIAKRKGEFSRVDDDTMEYQICLEFARERRTVARFYRGKAKRLRRLEKKARGKTRRK
jgi:phage anti-repressor protein